MNGDQRPAKTNHFEYFFLLFTSVLSLFIQFLSFFWCTGIGPSFDASIRNMFSFWLRKKIMFERFDTSSVEVIVECNLFIYICSRINLWFKADWIRAFEEIYRFCNAFYTKAKKFKSSSIKCSWFGKLIRFKSDMRMRLRIHRTVGHILEPARRFGSCVPKLIFFALPSYLTPFLSFSFLALCSSRYEKKCNV